MPDRSAVRADAARRYDAWFDDGWGALAWPVEARALLGALGPVAGRRVLDVGCGTGRLGALLASAGARVVGIDLDPAMLSVATGRVPEGLVCADAAALPLADASVAAAVTLATLEFTHAPAAVLAEMARVVRPGGRLVAAVLNPHSLWGLLDRPGRREPYRGGCFLDVAELLRLAGVRGKTARVGALFTAPQLPLPRPAAVIVERAGNRLLPRMGALQVVTVQVPQ